MTNHPKNMPPAHRERLLDLSTGKTVSHPALLDLTMPDATLPAPDHTNGDASGKVVRPEDASLPNVRNEP